MIWALLFALLRAVVAELVAEGPHIMDAATNTRVKLRCLNWYGAHQELFVVGGLELRGVEALADLFVSTGANCARIPYSIEMARSNPVVKRSAVAGILPSECNSTERALDVMDCVAEHLRRRNIMLIFNCHNSWAGWVGTTKPSEQQGLWNLPGYSTEDWLRSLETMVSRYSMAGIDLRNEIHDQDGVRITWGESTDPDTDWLAASSMACDRLHAIDPTVLIIVGGLCWNMDLRRMMWKVGPVQAYYRSKLVYTAHVYPWSFWWHMDPELFNMIRAACGFFTLLAFCFALMCSINYYNRHKQFSKLCVSKGRGNSDPVCDWLFLSMVLSSSVIFFACWLAAGLMFRTTANAGGCSSIANDADWLIHVCIVFTVASTMLLCCHYSYYSDTAFASLWFVWFGLFAFSLLMVTNYLSGDQSMLDFMGIWALHDRPVPVWVGEFGTDVLEAPRNKVWQLLWNFIRYQHDLDWAYWPFNGRQLRDMEWQNEGFGIVNYNYTGLRDVNFANEIFK